MLAQITLTVNNFFYLFMVVQLMIAVARGHITKSGNEPGD